MKLIVGLGNVGKEYKNTRHNVGFMVLDEYLNGVKWSKNSYGYYYKKKNTIFLKPSTYMNLSGNAILYYMNYFKIHIDDILVIHDDLDINIGKFKLKTNSSSGGHNGIKSIIKELKTNYFLRLKIGISKSINIDTSDFVLGKFTKEEVQKIDGIMGTIYEVVDDFISNDSADILMNKYNG